MNLNKDAYNKVNMQIGFLKKTLLSSNICMFREADQNSLKCKVSFPP